MDDLKHIFPNDRELVSIPILFDTSLGLRELKPLIFLSVGVFGKA